MSQPARWRPGPALVPIMIIAALPALAAPWWPLLGPVAMVMVILVLVAALIEGLAIAHAAPQAEHAAAVLSLGEDEVLTWRIHHRCRMTLRLVLRHALPECLGGGSGSGQATCQPGRTCEAVVNVRGCARDHDTLGLPWIAWTAFGLTERLAIAAATPVPVTVLPNLRAVGRMMRRLDALYLAGLGQRMAPRAGNGREFSRLREYVQGDDLRQVDWKASARRDHLVSREFRIERAQDIFIAIDHSQGMAARSGGLSWCDRAVDAALSLATFAGRGEDRVGACSFALDVTTGPAPARGGSHAAQLTSFLGRIHVAECPQDWPMLATRVRHSLRNRSLIVIFATLPERGEHHDLLRAMRLLSSRHLPLLIAFRDPALRARAEDRPQDRHRLRRAVVAGTLVDGRETTLRELRELGVLVDEVDPADSIETAINAYISVKRRQLL